ncbi:MAG: hypothetical protein SNH63_01865 [Rikenellaceae bacterium]
MKKLTPKQWVAISAVILALAYYFAYVNGTFRITFVSLFGFMIPFYGLFNAMAAFFVVRAFFTSQKNYCSYPLAIFVIATIATLIARYVFNIYALYSAMVFVSFITFGATVGIMANSVYEQDGEEDIDENRF